MLSPEFILTSLLVILIPGTGVVYTLSQGLFGGVRASLAAALGCTLGIVPHLLASIIGLSFILHMSALVFTALKLLGALYLLYLAWALWREEGALNFGGHGETSLGRIVWRAVLLNLLNPKLTLFFFAFLPLSLSPEATSPLLQMLLLSLVFMALTLIVFVLYGLLASSLQQRALRSPRVILWLKRSFAASFALLGIRLVLTTR